MMKYRTTKMQASSRAIKGKLISLPFEGARELQDTQEESAKEEIKAAEAKG